MEVLFYPNPPDIHKSIVLLEGSLASPLHSSDSNNTTLRCKMNSMHWWNDIEN